MKKCLFPSIAMLWLLQGCANSATTHVASDTQLGRVVIYRNGVAYFERFADVTDGSLKVTVPGDKVDDFLKSLTVVDTRSGKPAPVSYPSLAGSGTVDMKVQLDGPAPHRVRLSYVTEAPAWKPTYRAMLGQGGKVSLQAWAIVDNTSAEDWNNVKLGVGSSSAMAFRFDLRSLKFVQRETLENNGLFAIAPPMGGASYGQSGKDTGNAGRMYDFSDEAIASADGDDAKKAEMTRPTVPAAAARGGLSGGAGQASNHRPEGDVRRGGAPKSAKPTAKSPDPIVNEPARSADRQQSQAQINALAQQNRATGNTIVVEGWAAPGDKDKMGASLERANKLRDQLILNGADASRVIAIGKGAEAERPQGGVRVREQVPANVDPKAAAANVAPGDPVGVSHFESGTTMSVPKGTSAMVSILAGATDGEVVYLYDPETQRGNAQFPFKALRFKNPTDSVLESGPVSVFGEGRFIGEGLSEPIPAHAVAFVPFALDRQILVETKNEEQDRVARVITAARGVFQTETKHTRKSKFVLYNRTQEAATVYLRHTVPQGYTLGEAPPHVEKLGGATLFRVSLTPGEKKEISIEEHTPVFRTTDIRTPHGLEQIRLFVSEGAQTETVKTKLTEIIRLNSDIGKIEEQIATTREQMGEYRQRMDELHAQIVTLKAVRTAGPLMQNLEKKLSEVSERLSKATVEVVSLEEKRMVARIRLQDAISEITIEKAEPQGSGKKG
ncbi:MAG: DUF4139 domain-containing protein [Polyangiaceae bacterium]